MFDKLVCILDHPWCGVVSKPIHTISAKWLVEKAGCFASVNRLIAKEVVSEVTYIIWNGTLNSIQFNWILLSVLSSVHFVAGGTSAAAPPPFRPGNPDLCGSYPLVTPYYCRLGDLLCFVFTCMIIVFFCYMCNVCVPSVLWYCWLGLLTCKNRHPYNLYCVGGDVKPCSIKLSQCWWKLLSTCMWMVHLTVNDAPCVLGSVVELTCVCGLAATGNGALWINWASLCSHLYMIF